MTRMTGANWFSRRNGAIAFPRVALMAVLSGLLTLTMSRPFMLMTVAVSHANGVDWRQWGYSTLLVVCLVVAYFDGPRSRFVIVPPLLLPLIVWSAASITWSSVPEVSAKRLLLTGAIILGVSTAVDRLGARRSILTAQIILFAFLIASLVAVILFPYFGIQNYYDVERHWWRGVMANKNIAGMSTSLTVLFFSLYGSKATMLLRYGVAAIAALFLFYTDSSTSIIGAAVSLTVGAAVLFAFSRASQSDHPQISEKMMKVSLLVVWCVLTAALAFLAWEGTWLLELTRNPELFTGRGKIWQPMILSFLRSPFLGSGYGAFWDAGASAGVVRAGPLAGVTQGHNGYLDLAVQIGIPGLVLAVGALVLWPMLLIMRLRSSADQLCSLASAVLIFFVINNLTESSIFDGDQILQVFMILIVAALFTSLRRLETSRSIKNLNKRRSGDRSQVVTTSFSSRVDESGYPRQGKIKRKRRYTSPTKLD